MNNKVIYTSLTGGYDNLPQYPVIDPSFDYVCFSNDYPANVRIGQWLIKPIPLENGDSLQMSRYAKLLPHEVLPEYQWSIWMDSNLEINHKEIYEAFKKCIRRNDKWSGIVHPSLDCIYMDIKACLQQGKIHYSQILSNIAFLRKEHYPRNNGLFENNIILRAHNSEIVKEIDNLWWEYFQKYAHRDQFSLYYIFWKKNFPPSLIFASDLNTHNMSGIQFRHHSKLRPMQRARRKLRVIQNRIFLLFNRL